VTWTNDDSAPHTVTAADGSFDSGMLAAGAVFRRTLPAAGTFPYTCVCHAGMTGTVVVSESASTPPPPPRPAARPRTARTASATAPAGPASATVSMRDNDFAPRDLTVPAGTTVVFRNDGALPHTATATDGSFDSGIVPAGGTWSTTLDTPGSYSYDCIIHPGMSGTITVASAAMGTAPAPPSGPGAVGSAAATTDPGVDWPAGVATGVRVLLGGALLALGIALVDSAPLRRRLAVPARAAAVAAARAWMRVRRAAGARHGARLRPRMP
jgi:plastocyanin